MNDRLLNLLTRAVAEGWISEAAAAAILANADGISNDLLALELADAIRPPTDEELRETLRFYGSRERDAAQDYFLGLMAILAASATAVSRWHQAMRLQVAAHLRHQLERGLGGPITPAWRARWAETTQTQLAYLSRFADQVALRQLAGQPMSMEQIAARARLYAGAGRAAWFLAAESRMGDDEVVDYIARDDNTTCAPCAGADAGSPYLPGLGPMPGDVCFGRGLCRCRRVSRLDPVAAARLRDQQS